MADESALQRAVMWLTETVQPDRDALLREVEEFRRAHPVWDRDKLAEKWANRICWLYAGEGAATALPGVIPGLGTLAQVSVEGAAISADLAYMLRCMAGMCMGIARTYERDVDAPFNQEFVRVLGLWCGVLSFSKEATARVASKIAIAQFKRVPGEIFKRINRKVGTTIVTKYGTKRGGIAIGRLIPFGVGAVVGGSFNLATMKGFKAAALRYYRSDGDVLTEA